MNEPAANVLPYRADGPSLLKLINARARGRSLEQIQALNFPRKTFEGTVTTAVALGLLDDETSALTEPGQRIALAAPDEQRTLLLTQLVTFPPYDLLIEAIFDRDATETPLDWIETWWNTQGFGSSRSNRSEGSTSFARLIEFVGMGSYVAGRRGHPTRIEWASNAAATIHAERGSGPTLVPEPVSFSAGNGEPTATGERAMAKREGPAPRIDAALPIEGNSQAPVRQGEPRSKDAIDVRIPLTEGMLSVALPKRITAREAAQVEAFLGSLLKMIEISDEADE